MRTKRTIASFFLFFAGIVLLAHTVVPHHHNELTTIVYFFNLPESHCNHSSTNQCDTDNCELPDGDCQETGKNCTDANIILKGGEDTREELKAATNEIIPLLLLFSGTENCVAQIEHTNYDFNISIVPPSYTDYLPDSQGLRAPPVC